MTAEAPEFSQILLDQMKNQHKIYCGQRDQTAVNFQQLTGAIAALETLIKTQEEQLNKAS